MSANQGFLAGLARLLFCSLYRKLAAVFLALTLLLAASVLVINVQGTRAYVDEVEQRLNRELAAHLVAEQPLLVSGEVDQAGLAHVFHTLMIINPKIECYLLDREGEVLAFDAPEGHVKSLKIDLAPVSEFLAGASLPIRGSDPRDPERSKIFSVAPLEGPNGETEGYLYVVLAGEQYASIADRLGASQVLKVSLWSLAGAALLAAALGLLLFRLLTRRLRGLQRDMASFESSGFREAPPVASPPKLPVADEIGHLERNFRRMALRIIEQVDGLERLDDLRRELLTNVSHDLRTPVSSLQGYLETLLLKEGSLSNVEKHEYLSIALSQSERLGRLVGELFELARLESGDVTLERELFSLAELVQDIVQSFALRGAERGVTLESDLRQSSFRVVGDLRLIERTLQNLLDNALRHTRDGGHIMVSVRDHGNAARVSVTDDGCGIPAEEIPRIFERFYQGDSRLKPAESSAKLAADSKQSASNGHAGAGLGLAIAKRVVELHDSTIEVHSRLGAGTTFAFDLACA